MVQGVQVIPPGLTWDSRLALQLKRSCAESCRNATATKKCRVESFDEGLRPRVEDPVIATNHVWNSGFCQELANSAGVARIYHHQLTW